MPHRRAVTSSRLAASGLAAVALLATVVVVDPAAAAPATPTAGGAVRRHHPAPSHFTRGRIDNPWFPLKAGNRYVYRGTEGSDRLRDVLISTYRTKVVDGITCRVVFDQVWRNGVLDERTHDFYAQTTGGTVWYFGEHTATLDRHGHVISREGSFMSGRDGAEAGIFMTRHPHPGPSFHQEDYPGHAEDVFTVVRRGAHVVVPLMDSHHALLSRETTVLEPGVVDHKYYVRDVGTVREVTVKGGSESLWLVGLTHLPRG